jgi:hypothetical protein
MSDKDPSFEPSDDDVADFEDAIADEKESVIQLKCPICGERDFETIQLYGQYIMYWQPGPPSLYDKVISTLVSPRRVSSYRCLHCDYILMFARPNQ